MTWWCSSAGSSRGRGADAAGPLVDRRATPMRNAASTAITATKMSSSVGPMFAMA
ncbi:hypothetical protein ACWDR1_30330 [Streptosporangium sandarakinum]